MSLYPKFGYPQYVYYTSIVINFWYHKMPFIFLLGCTRHEAISIKWQLFDNVWATAGQRFMGPPETLEQKAIALIVRQKTTSPGNQIKWHSLWRQTSNSITLMNRYFTFLPSMSSLRQVEYGKEVPLCCERTRQLNSYLRPHVYNYICL